MTRKTARLVDEMGVRHEVNLHHHTVRWSERVMDRWKDRRYHRRRRRGMERHKVYGDRHQWWWMWAVVLGVLLGLWLAG